MPTFTRLPNSTPAQQAEALRLRREGMDYLSIAIALGRRPDPAAGRMMVMRALKREAASANMTTRKFGVEIEFVGISRQAAVAALTAAGINAQDMGYTHQVTSHWKVVSDASLSGHYSGELVSPPLSGPEGFAQLEKAIKAMVQAGARVSRACGLHVHHDANDLTAAQLGNVVLYYAANRNQIDKMMPRSRRHSRWAKPYTTFTRNQIAYAAANPNADARDVANVTGDRYHDVNMRSFVKYGTLEFRQHGGTLNAKKVIAWVRMGQAIVEAAIKMDDIDVHNDFNDMLDNLVAKGDLAEDQATFLKARAARMR